MSLSDLRWVAKCYKYHNIFLSDLNFFIRALTFLWFNIFARKFLWNHISSWNVHFRGLLVICSLLVPHRIGNGNFGRRKITLHRHSFRVFLDYQSCYYQFYGVPKVNKSLKDLGNERFRTRCDSTKIFINKYWKTKKLELGMHRIKKYYDILSYLEDSGTHLRSDNDMYKMYIQNVHMYILYAQNVHIKCTYVQNVHIKCAYVHFICTKCTYKMYICTFRMYKMCIWIQKSRFLEHSEFPHDENFIC